jgi:uncharacterized protein YdaU (DUF1376 family)
MNKVRRVDFYPDEFLGGVAGLLTATEIGVYWMVCTRIYSEGGPIKERHELLARICRMRVNDLAKVLNRLVDMEKLARDDEGNLYQKRAERELKAARSRIESAAKNGRNGGRPPENHNENNGTTKPPGSFAQKLTTNHQPSTINLTPVVPLGDGADLFGETPGSKPKRKTRLPADLVLTEDMAKYAQARIKTINPVKMFQAFRDYHDANGTLMASWPAAWRNWVNMEEKRGARR